MIEVVIKSGDGEQFVREFLSFVAITSQLKDLEHKLEKALHKLNLIEERLQVMATREELDTALDGVVTAVNALGTDLQTTLADLQSKITAGQDFSAELEKANSIASQLSTLDASVKAADPGVPPAPPAPAE